MLASQSISKHQKKADIYAEDLLSLLDCLETRTSEPKIMLSEGKDVL